MPTGPWIVISLSTVALLSIFMAPGRGILGRLLRQSRNRNKMLRENILKALYQLGEKAGNLQQQHSFDQLMRRREFLPPNLRKGLNQLRRKGQVTYRNDLYHLTDEGLEEAKRIVKLHRLWEMYLTVRMRMPADHVHNNAEAIEHVITPEIEAMLEEELGYPTTDPHDSHIPYQNPEPAK
jgi:manganese/zinc/iron transport system permease protein